MFIGVWDQFCWGGGGGAEDLSAYFLHCLPEYYLFFCPKCLFEKLLYAYGCVFCQNVLNHNTEGNSIIVVHSKRNRSPVLR